MQLSGLQVRISFSQSFSSWSRTIKIPDFKDNHPLKSLQCLNAYTAREKLKCPRVPAQILGRVTGEEPEATAPGCGTGTSHPLTGTKQLCKLTQTGCKGSPPKWTMQGKDRGRTHTEGVQAQGCCICSRVSQHLHQPLCPTSSGILHTSSEVPLSLLSCALMMSVGINALNSELSSIMCQRLRETPVQADQNSLALFLIKNLTAK